VVRADGSAVLLSDGKLQMMRCVREFDRSEVGGTIEWHLLTWSIGRVGVSFKKYATLNEALLKFQASPKPVRLA